MQEGSKTPMLQTLPGQLHILLHEGRWRHCVDWLIEGDAAITQRAWFVCPSCRVSSGCSASATWSSVVSKCLQPSGRCSPSRHASPRSSTTRRTSSSAPFWAPSWAFTRYISISFPSFSGFRLFFMKLFFWFAPRTGSGWPRRPSGPIMCRYYIICWIISQFHFLLSIHLDSTLCGACLSECSDFWSIPWILCLSVQFHEWCHLQPLWSKPGCRLKFKVSLNVCLASVRRQLPPDCKSRTELLLPCSPHTALHILRSDVTTTHLCRVFFWAALHANKRIMKWMVQV